MRRPAVDPAGLAALVDQAGGREDAHAILRIFLDLLDARRDAVLHAPGRRERADAAHALRSPSQLVGALRLEELCARIEARADADGRVTPDDLSALARECERVRADLRRALGVPAEA